MLANAMFVATLIFLALGIWLSSQLRFLTPWRGLILHSYAQPIAIYCALLFANILGLAIWMERKFFLRDTGRKLKHLDQEIHSGHNELSQEITDAIPKKSEKKHSLRMSKPPGSGRRPSKPYYDRSMDMVARIRAAKEAAQREMEEFGDVSEYEVRIICGQKRETPDMESKHTREEANTDPLWILCATKAK